MVCTSLAGGAGVAAAAAPTCISSSVFQLSQVVIVSTDDAVEHFCYILIKTQDVVWLDL